MGFLGKERGKRPIYADVPQNPYGYTYVQKWTNPATAAAAAVLSAQSIAAGGVVTTFAGQPDFPRNLTVVASGAATGNVVVTGLNVRGATITETLALNGATPVVGNKAFASVTSVSLPTVAATTINLGTGVKLGLERLLVADLLLAVSAAGVYETTRPTVAVSSTAIESNTMQTNTAPNGSRTFIAVYVTSELTAARRVTS